ncbi:MAG: 7-cyano-7-deazaguanine synthase QueC [Candidatus Eisenbacteria bacterium]|nr:7-cyano-7-deazaguanine synthase QueC [Candidatus Eisenbacteria bacterium]
MPSRAVVLLSGGLDSAVALAVARRDCEEVFALTVRYGQRHAIETECARNLARLALAREHKILDVDLASFGGSSLTGDGPVPKANEERSPDGEIPSTYVPARNTILLSLALAWAEVLGAEAIYIGAHTEDAGGYPDTRPEYLEAFARLAALATRAGVEGRAIQIRAPLLRMSKAEVVKLGRSLGVDFSATSSCYDPLPSGRPCGLCDACRLRAKGFGDAGEIDPRLADRP